MNAACCQVRWQADGRQLSVLESDYNGTARDRMGLILDPESPFLELMPTAGYNIEHSSPCASVLCGIGLVK